MLNLFYDNMGENKGSAIRKELAQIKVIQTELNEAEQASGRFQEMSATILLHLMDLVCQSSR